MIMTEEDARTKWCPLTMGRAGDGRDISRCMASVCMAWRWGGELPGSRQPEPPRRGYCGMAGPVVTKEPSDDR